MLITISAACCTMDLDTRAGRTTAAHHASEGDRRQLVLLTTNGAAASVAQAAGVAWQLHGLGLGQLTLVLVDSNATCTQLGTAWRRVGLLAGGADVPGCGWSAAFVGRLEKYYGRRSRPTRLWALWSAKWLLMLRLARAPPRGCGLDVLALDNDVMVLADPLALLGSPPLRSYSLVVAPEAARVNLGVVFVRGESEAQNGSVTGGVAVLHELVRRLRYFLAGGEQVLTNARGQAALQALWDQGLFVDSMLSVVRGRRVYPYSYLQASSSRAWRLLGWPPSSMGRRQIEVGGMVRWRLRLGCKARHRGTSRHSHASAASSDASTMRAAHRATAAQRISPHIPHAGTQAALPRSSMVGQRTRCSPGATTRVAWCGRRDHRTCCRLLATLSEPHGRSAMRCSPIACWDCQTSMATTVRRNSSGISSKARLLPPRTR